jgi:hypothetical protein
MTARQETIKWKTNEKPRMSLENPKKALGPQPVLSKAPQAWLERQLWGGLALKHARVCACILLMLELL